MTKVKVKEDGTIASCADPRRPFQPRPPNNCNSCKDHSDVTCHDFAKQPKELKK
jgi:hypothetical protein